jgi:hypothetical protein
VVVAEYATLSASATASRSWHSCRLVSSCSYTPHADGRLAFTLLAPGNEYFYFVLISNFVIFEEAEVLAE